MDTDPGRRFTQACGHLSTSAVVSKEREHEYDIGNVEMNLRYAHQVIYMSPRVDYLSSLHRKLVDPGARRG
jgi:hypothetical protein